MSCKASSLLDESFGSEVAEPCYGHDGESRLGELCSRQEADWRAECVRCSGRVDVFEYFGFRDGAGGGRDGFVCH